MKSSASKSLTKANSKELATPEDRAKVVSVQLDTKLIIFTAKPGTAVELTEKYGHLKNLPIDDAKSYDDLVKAIADVRVNRTTTAKEKAVHKAPALAWNAEAEKKAKAIIEPLQALEDTLKEEKERIDAIKAENKRRIAEAALRAKQKQADNLNELRNLYADTSDMSIDDLKDGLAHLQAPEELNENDYGDYLEDAQAALRAVRIRLNSAIAQLEKAAELEQQQLDAQKKLDDIAAQERIDKTDREEAAKNLQAIQDKKDKDTADADAAKQKIIDDQAATIKAMKEAAEPKDESNLSGMSDAVFSSILEGEMPNAKIPTSGNIKIADTQEPEEKPAVNASLILDAAMMTRFIRELNEAATKAPEFSNKEFTIASDRVVDNLVNACKFLLGTINKVMETGK